MPPSCMLTTIVPHSSSSTTTTTKMERRALALALRRADPFFLIAGPCVLESERVVMAVAARCVHRQRDNPDHVPPG